MTTLFRSTTLAVLLVSGSIAFAQGPAPRTPVVTPPAGKIIYPPTAAAAKDIKAAITLAHRTHKRILLDFGGDWCGDCQVLDIYFHQSPNAELLAKYFIKVNVNIGREDANTDISAHYGIPMPHGVPALAVLDPDGNLIYAQKNEFSDMRYMQPTSVTEFLQKWKQ